ARDNGPIGVGRPSHAREDAARSEARKTAGIIDPMLGDWAAKAQPVLDTALVPSEFHMGEMGRDLVGGAHVRGHSHRSAPDGRLRRGRGGVSGALVSPDRGLSDAPESTPKERFSPECASIQKLDSKELYKLRGGFGVSCQRLSCDPCVRSTVPRAFEV